MKTFAAATLALALAGTVMAQTPPPRPTTPGGPAWSELSLAQQAALSPLKGSWNGIDASRKTKWIIVAQRFDTLSNEDRQRVQARMAAWAAMTPAERGQARQNFQDLRNLPAADRQALWDAYRTLPPEQQREWARQPQQAATRKADATAAPESRRIVPVNPPPVPAKPVSPTVVQVKPGATTNLVTRRPSPPPHNQPGLPRIAATPGFVQPNTLLPSRGPQGAAVMAPAPASAAASAASEP